MPWRCRRDRQHGVQGQRRPHAVAHGGFFHRSATFERARRCGGGRCERLSVAITTASVRSHVVTLERKQTVRQRQAVSTEVVILDELTKTARSMAILEYAAGSGARIRIPLLMLAFADAEMTFVRARSQLTDGSGRMEGWSWRPEPAISTTVDNGAGGGCRWVDLGHGSCRRCRQPAAVASADLAGCDWRLGRCWRRGVSSLARASLAPRGSARPSPSGRGARYRRARRHR